MKNKLCYILCFMLFSCSEDNCYNYKLENNYKDSILNSVFKNANTKGINKLNDSLFFENDTLFKTAFNSCEAVRGSDTVYLYFIDFDYFTTFKIFKNHYSVELKILDKYKDVILIENNHILDGYNYSPELAYHSLMLKNENFNIGDTIIGSYTIKTKEFQYDFKYRISSFNSPFIMIIQKRDTARLNLLFQGLI